MANPVRQFLNPRRKLVEETADWLCGTDVWPSHVRDDCGAKSLAHVMVIVPTAQSGRSLRLALARKAAANGWGGVLPPQVVQPMQIIVPADNSLRTASTIQLRAAFLRFLAERPRRRTVEGRTVLTEWNNLFRPEFILDFASHLSFLDQLGDIWRVLAGGGLLMREVRENAAAAELLAAAEGDEVARWDELAEFETAFFDFLHARGLRHEVEGIHLARSAAQPLPESIEEVVLPGLLDPVAVVYDVLHQQRDQLKISVLIPAAPAETERFDAWGRPKTEAWIGRNSPVLTGIRDTDVVRAGTDAALAKRLAADFPPAGSACAVPSLGLCDEALYPELAAAFLNVGYELHNPERHALCVSSLGRIIDNLITLFSSHAGELPWEPFVALLRENDVIWPVLNAIPRNAEGGRPGRRAVLEGIDVCRNVFLPHALPASCAFDESRLQAFERAPCAAFCAAARSLADLIRAAHADTGGASVAGFVRGMLQRLYAGRGLGDGEGAREFRAAAEAVRDVLRQFDDETVAGLGLAEGALVGLLRKTVAEASYSLEPDSCAALRTEGWLELAWSDADRIALAGFHEGSVPDSVTGHAFLPGSLRSALGLTSNDQRLARDTCILKLLLDARAGTPGAVRAYVALTNNAGDIHRPSRLLFLVEPSRLADRARRLFGELPPEAALPGRAIAPGWLPALPEDPPPYGKSERHPEGRLSASAIDMWLKCPFTYLFQYGLGMRTVEEKDELEANDFGTLIHRALELYALEQLDRTAKGLAQLHELADIEAAFDRIMGELRLTYGARQSVNLRLQLDAAAGRLRCFARIQAKWAEEGWNIAVHPEYGFYERPFAGECDCDVAIRGSVDRIDYKEGVGYRIIDYKTWDRKGGVRGRVLGRGVAQARHAARLQLPVLNPAAEEKVRERFLSVQPFLYGRCLEKAEPERFAGRIADYCYVLLGRTAEDTVVFGSADDQGAFEAVKTGKPRLVEMAATALDTARTAIRRIRGGFFWPPGPTEEWRREVRDLLTYSPEGDFRAGTAWRDRQERMLDELGGEGTRA